MILSELASLLHLSMLMGICAGSFFFFGQFDPRQITWKEGTPVEKTLPSDWLGNKPEGTCSSAITNVLAPAQPTADGATPGQEVLSCIRKQATLSHGKQASKQLSSLAPASRFLPELLPPGSCLSSFPGFLK